MLEAVKTFFTAHPDLIPLALAIPAAAAIIAFARWRYKDEEKDR